MTSDGESRQPPRWCRVLGRPVVWSVGCAAVALPFFLRGEGLEFLPFVLALVAGWLAGTAFVDSRRCPTGGNNRVANRMTKVYSY